MQFLTVLVLASLCCQSVTEMNQKNCTKWNNLEKQYETSIDNQNTMNLKLDNQSRLIEEWMKNLMKEMTAIRHENEELRNDMTGVNTNLEIENEHLKTKSQQLKQENTNLNKSLTDVIEVKDNLEKENEVIKTDIQQLKQENVQLNTSLTDVTQMNLNLTRKIQRLTEENTKLNGSMQDCSPPTQSSCNQSTGTWISGGSRINYTFSSVFYKVKLRDQKHDMYQFTEWATRMSVVGDKLWVPFYSNHTIRVLDPYTPHNISMISHPQLTKPNDILQMNCTVIVSSGSGLHVLDIKGAYLYNITGGKFSGPCTRGDVVYVYKGYNITAGYIVTLEYSSGRWGVKDTFPVRGGSGATITVVQDTLYVSSLFSDTIYTYSLTGTYITQYGSLGNNSPGQLDYPYLCGQDKMGSLIICDSHNHRLQLLSPNGTWQVVGLGVGRYPRDVVIDVSGTVWVLLGNKITRYSV